MTRRTRLAALTGALLLPIATLAACGGDDGGGAGGGSESSASSGLDQVSVSGEPGKAPTVKFEGSLEPEGIDSEVLTEGDGEEVSQGDSVLAHVWVGNGFTEKKSYSTYDIGSPQLIALTDQLSKPLAEAFEGHTVGSRVAVTSSARDAFGPQGNPQMGIGTDDSVVFVVDLVDTVASGPTGTEKQPAAWAPAVTEKGGKVTGLDFSGTPEPDGTLQQTTLVEGDGETVKKGQTIYVDYLGQVYDAKKPFDDSYSRGTPASFEIGVGAVVKGWDEVLVGQQVGSRVIMAIPPEMGYGKQGNPQAGIKGTDTLYFVVDVLAAR